MENTEPELNMYSLIIGSLAKQTSEVAYDVLDKHGLLPANDNTKLDSKEGSLSVVDTLSLYAAGYAQIQYDESPLGKLEIDTATSKVNAKFVGGLEELLSLPEDQLLAEAYTIQKEAIKTAYSSNDNPMESALMYVTNGGQTKKTLENIFSNIQSQSGMSDEQKSNEAQMYGLIAQSDVYVRAKRAEEVFGVELFNQEGQLMIPEKHQYLFQNPANDNYAPSSSSDSSSDDKAA